MYKKLIAACLLCLVLNAHAGFTSGNDLVKFLQEYENRNLIDRPINLIEIGHLVGYVAGVSDTANRALFCLPQSTNIVQVIAVVSQFLKSNPARWAEPANVLVVEGLVKAFPCGANK